VAVAAWWVVGGCCVLRVGAVGVGVGVHLYLHAAPMPHLGAVPVPLPSAASVKNSTICYLPSLLALRTSKNDEKEAYRGHIFGERQPGLISARMLATIL
jgi:hypothetical protein